MYRILANIPTYCVLGLNCVLQINKQKKEVEKYPKTIVVHKCIENSDRSSVFI